MKKYIFFSTDLDVGHLTYTNDKCDDPCLQGHKYVSMP